MEIKISTIQTPITVRQIIFEGKGHCPSNEMMNVALKEFMMMNFAVVYNQVNLNTVIPVGTKLRLPYDLPSQSKPSWGTTMVRAAPPPKQSVPTVPEVTLMIFTPEQAEKIFPGIWNILKNIGPGSFLNPNNIGDAKTIRLVMEEFGLKGKFYIKNIQGTDHVVFKGYAGTRAVWNSPKYGLSHPKIARIGIGTKNLAKGVTNSAFVGFVIYSGLTSLEAVLRAFGNDPMGWEEFGAQIAAGAVNAALSGAAGFVAAELVTLGAGMVPVMAGTLAVPVLGLVVAFAAAFYVGYKLGYMGLDRKIADSLAQELETAWQVLKAKSVEATNELTSRRNWERFFIFSLTNGECSDIQCLLDEGAW